METIHDLLVAAQALKAAKEAGQFSHHLESILHHLGATTKKPFTVPSEARQKVLSDKYFFASRPVLQGKEKCIQYAIFPNTKAGTKQKERWQEESRA